MEWVLRLMLPPLNWLLFVGFKCEALRSEVSSSGVSLARVCLFSSDNSFWFFSRSKNFATLVSWWNGIIQTYLDGFERVLTR